MGVHPSYDSNSGATIGFCTRMTRMGWMNMDYLHRYAIQ